MKEKKGRELSPELQNKIKLLTGRDFWSTQDFPELGARTIKFADGPHGLRVQSGSADNFGLNGSLAATSFAENSSAACSWDEDLLFGTGERLGQEAAYFGAGVLLGPSVNIKRNPLGGRNFEYFSEDPYLTGRLAAAYIKGVQKKGVSCCVKHFAANNREFARTVCDSVLSRRALREIYLEPFEMCVKEGKAGAVMTAYNKVNGVHCSENEQLISGILRGEWGFDGIVISDWVGTHDRVAGIKAGEDIEMPRCKLSYGEIEKALLNGELSERDIDKCVSRIADFSQKWGKKTDICGFEEHSAYVQKVAESSIVLLKNDGVLPLKKRTKVAVIGAYAEDLHIQGGGSAHVNCKHKEDVLACLGQTFDIVGYERGYEFSGKRNKKLIKRAAKLASCADAVILFVGLNGSQDTEGADKSGISLPLCQTELIDVLAKTGKKIIVSLASGSSVHTDWDINVNALLQNGLFGQSGCKAFARILCGEVNPSGKLCESYPVSYGDLPCAESFGSDPYTERYAEDIFVGYRWFDGADISPKYPFGFGLSYTSFEYGGLTVDASGVRFTVKNIGTADGAEVAQLYISYPDCGLILPVKALKGFKKVFLHAGESAELFIPFDEYTFRIFDDILDSWRIFTGQYGIMVGSSSRDIRLECKVLVGGEDPAPCGDTKQDIIEAAKKATPHMQEDDVRQEITLYTPFIKLKNAKGAGGRLLYRVADKVCSKNPAMQTFRYLYVRSIAQYAGFNGTQAQGLLLVCNGHFFRGLKKIIFKK
ncbi:MAG: glycoside hydrolase family 3 C-terminal domain-containing protein [Clostridia bacterium]|nr:glycoside hydrolase family 3 C-terminal domain-containing protein [Clostridia bacterium]